MQLRRDDTAAEVEANALHDEFLLHVSGTADSKPRSLLAEAAAGLGGAVQAVGV